MDRALLYFNVLAAVIVAVSLVLLPFLGTPAGIALFSTVIMWNIVLIVNTGLISLRDLLDR